METIKLAVLFLLMWLCLRMSYIRSMKSQMLFYCLLFSLAVNAQRKIERAIAKEPAFKGAQVSVSVFNLKKQKHKVSFRSEINILPASTIKLFTLLGALQTFGNSLPMLHYAKQKGRFYFWSSGYPLINHPKYDSGEVLQFLAEQQDSLFYVPRPMSSPALGSGWAWDDQGYGFSAKKSSFPIHGNLIQVIANPSKDTLRVYPPIFNESVGYKKDSLFYNINVNKHKYRLRVDKADTLYIPFTPSNATFSRILEDKLDAPIYIGGKSDVLELKYKTLYTSKSTVYEALLHNSDNHIAESLVLMISGAFEWEFNTQIGLAKINQQNKALTGEITQLDGSGLSRYNLISPKALIKILNNLYKRFGSSEIKTYFPQLNLEGTLKDYAPGLSLGTVYAKSGSLKNNHVLAGYLFTASNKLYAFVISVNNYTADKQDVKKAIGEQLLRLYKKL